MNESAVDHDYKKDISIVFARNDHDVGPTDVLVGFRPDVQAFLQSSVQQLEQSGVQASRLVVRSTDQKSKNDIVILARRPTCLQVFFHLRCMYRDESYRRELQYC